MSSEALAWAFKQDVKPSGAKFTLVALCECANYKTGRITPSIAHLVEITGQNRKSIIAHIDLLERAGFITDTGERVGQTKQIKVYQPHLGTVPQTEPSLNRNSSDNGVKQSQKRDTEPSWEPSHPTDGINTTREEPVQHVLDWRKHEADKATAAKKASPKPHIIPVGWKPAQFGKATKSRAVVDGWPPGELAAQIEHFTAHHRGKGNRFTDWQDAWSTWVLNSRRMGTGNGRSNITQFRAVNGASADRRSSLARAIDEGLEWLG